VTASAPPSAAPTVGVTIADLTGSDRIFGQIPADWIVLTAADIASAKSFAAWQAAHPGVTADSAKIVADDMSTGGVSLFAFDGANTSSGFTPNLNVTWIDYPATNFASWLTGQAASVTKEYGLTTPLTYSDQLPSGDGTLSGYIGTYHFSASGLALAGMQFVVPQPSGRAAVLTFTCLSTQTDRYTPIMEPLFISLSTQG